MMRLWTGLIAVLIGCSAQPTPLPTEEAVAVFDRDAAPPLYQLLYTAPVLPADGAAQSQLRMLIWMRHMGLSASQLDQLESLRAMSAERAARIQAAEEAVVAQYAEAESSVHAAILEQVAAGIPIDDPIFPPLLAQLAELRAGGERERELMKLRMESMRSILEAESELLRSLSPSQEMMLADALFVLRAHLDPVANPGDYRALVGTTYEPGQYAVLTRGTGEGAQDPLNIGALWTDDGELTGYALHEARREVLLYLILLEPGLAEAIVQAKALL